MYIQLISDLEDWKFSVSLYTLEIGSLSHYELCAVKCLVDVFGLSKQLSKKHFSEIVKDLNCVFILHFQLEELTKMGPK